MAKIKWKTQREAFIEALTYLKGRQQGTITSLLTPWSSFNDATTNGIEWHTTTVIGARPATGKTMIKDIIVAKAFELNPLMKFRVLEFQFEMVGKATAIRSFSAHLGKSYKYMCSAEKNQKLQDIELKICAEFAKEKLKYPIDLVENPCTVIEFCEIIETYMQKYVYKESSHVNVRKEDGTIENKEVVETKYTPTFITLDHSLLLTRGPSEKSDQDTLYSLGRALTSLKRKYPISFLILSQLNRDIDKPERNEDGKYGNFILESDLFGADALLQHADTVIGLNRPGKQKLTYYGTERYMINKDENILAMHFLKCRNGATGVAFFRTDFKIASIIGMDAPAKHVRGLKI